jgi:hypothetical protein
MEDALIMALITVFMTVVVPVGLQMHQLADQRSALKLFTRGVSATGEITDRKTGGDLQKSYLLFVSFREPNGTVVSTKIYVSEGEYNRLSIGDAVPLVFDPRRPKKARPGPREALAHAEGFDAGCLTLTIWFVGMLALWMAWAAVSSMAWPDGLDEPRR